MNGTPSSSPPRWPTQLGTGTRPDAGQPLQQGSPLAAPGVDGSPVAASLAGIAWLVIALAAATAAPEQWAGVSARASQAAAFQASAVVNVGVAVIGLGLAILLVVRPTRSVLTTAGIAGLAVVVFGGLQVVVGTALTGLWVWSTLGALLAVGFSWAGRGQLTAAPA